MSQNTFRLFYKKKMPLPVPIASTTLVESTDSNIIQCMIDFMATQEAIHAEERAKVLTEFKEVFAGPLLEALNVQDSELQAWCDTMTESGGNAQFIAYLKSHYPDLLAVWNKYF